MTRPPQPEEPLLAMARILVADQDVGKVLRKVLDWPDRSCRARTTGRSPWWSLKGLGR
jgi:hypothetical protein